MTLPPRAESPRWAWRLGAALLFAVEAARLLPASSLGRTAAAVIWVGLAAAVLGGLASQSLATLRRPAGDTAWYALALLLPPVLILWGVTGYRLTAINLEAVAEVNEGLQNLAARRDWGLFGTGFLGYPARQYLLAALPSSWGGRHLLTLRLGFGLPYLAGYLAFVAGTFRFLASRGVLRPRLWAAGAGLLVALGNFPLLYARQFEQTLLPLALTCLFLGSMLSYLAERRAADALGLLWALGFLPYAYTPALATWVFAMVTLLVAGRHASPGDRSLVATALAYGAVTLGAALAQALPDGALARSLQVGQFAAGGGAGYTDGSLAAWIFRLGAGLHGAVGLEETLVPAPLALGVVLVLVHSLRRGDGRVAAVVGWAACTVICALTARGYAQRVPEFDLHRAMVVIPPLSLAVALYVATRTEEFGARGSALALQAAIVFMVLNAAALAWPRRAPRDHYPFVVTDLEEATLLVVDRAGPFPAAVYVAPPLTCPLELTLDYFCPGAAVIHARPPAGEHRPGAFVVSYVGGSDFIPEDPTARAEDYPVRFNRPRPYLAIAPE